MVSWLVGKIVLNTPQIWYNDISQKWHHHFNDIAWGWSGLVIWRWFYQHFAWKSEHPVQCYWCDDIASGWCHYVTHSPHSQKVLPHPLSVQSKDQESQDYNNKIVKSIPIFTIEKMNKIHNGLYLLKYNFLISQLERCSSLSSYYKL